MIRNESYATQLNVKYTQNLLNIDFLYINLNILLTELINVNTDSSVIETLLITNIKWLLNKWNPSKLVYITLDGTLDDVEFFNNVNNIVENFIHNTKSVKILYSSHNSPSESINKIIIYIKKNYIKYQIHAIYGYSDELLLFLFTLSNKHLYIIDNTHGVLDVNTVKNDILSRFDKNIETIYTGDVLFIKNVIALFVLLGNKYIPSLYNIYPELDKILFIYTSFLKQYHVYIITENTIDSTIHSLSIDKHLLYKFLLLYQEYFHLNKILHNTCQQQHVVSSKDYMIHYEKVLLYIFYNIINKSSLHLDKGPSIDQLSTYLKQ
jgi:hypothetical protein